MRILVLNYMIIDFTGSEINALQLCEGLRELGHEAEIGTFLLGSPMKEQVEKSGVNVIELLHMKKQELAYDLIWAHHSPVLAYLLYKMDMPPSRVIYSSLSWLLPLEAPPTFHDAIPLVLSVSPETSSILNLNGIPLEKILVFPNYAPGNFFMKPEKEYSVTPHKIAIISNHPPKEVLDFSEIARRNALTVDFIGKQHDTKFVDDYILRKYDLVLTIGKTVIYCFALRIPVYCYDHFDGPGYITPDNFQVNRITNFSGRGIDRKKDGEAIFKDITENYSENIKNLPFLYQEGDRYFNLEKNLKKVLDLIPDLPLLDIHKLRAEHSLDGRLYDLILEKQRYNLDLIKEQDILKEQIESYLNSKSFRLTRPLRVFKEFLKTLVAAR